MITKRTFLSRIRASFTGFKILAYAGNEAHIYINGDIDQNFGFSAKDLQAELKRVKSGDKVIVHINSYGGSVFEGLAIYNALKALPNEVTTIVESIAASMASIILLAGTKRKMYENAFVMIHNPMAGIEGDAEAFASKAQMLKDTQTNVTNIYETGLKLSRPVIEAAMKAETFYTAEEAFAAGFVTEIITTPDVKAAANLEKLVAKFQSFKGTKDMNFEQWLAAQCTPLGLVVASLTQAQRDHFKTLYDAHMKALTTPPTIPPTPGSPPGNNRAELEAQELERSEAINAAMESVGEVTLNADHLKKIGCTAKTVKGLAAFALRNKWTVDKFELECRRATVIDVGHVGIHSENSITDVNPMAISCALAKVGGMPAKQEHKWTGEKYGYENVYDQKTLEASDKIKDISILQVYSRMYAAVHGYHYQGRLNTPAFLKAARETLRKFQMSGNTSWSALNIFDDLANKFLWAAYNSVNTTWQEWVHRHSVSDFKTHNFYRLTMTGGYKKVGPDGMLAHGGFTDSKLTTAAETYGKIVGMTRTDLINDDMGAFNGIMSGLGMEGAKFLEELFYVQLLGQLTTLFPTNDANKNYISGAPTDLGVDGLTLALTKYGNQVDADYSPILQDPEILLHGTQDEVIAGELYREKQLSGVQSANEKKRPDNNPHVGKLRPVKSGYLNNTNIKQRIPEVLTAVPNQSSDQWLVLGKPNTPMGGIIIGAFLNGVITPTIEQDENDNFNMLGMQWRTVHDAGASNGDPKLGVYSKGAA